MFWLTLASMVLSVVALVVSVGSFLFARFVESQLIDLEAQLEQFEQAFRRKE